MKIIITGFSGFVSKHFLDLLNKSEPGSEVLGIDRNIPQFNSSDYPDLKIRFEKVDLLDKDLIRGFLSSYDPGFILHLASVSSVAQSWQTPLDSFVNNTNIFLNIIEQIRLNGSQCRILSVGSSEEFGEVTEKELPLTEGHPLKPLSPYAVARISQEMLSKVYADGYKSNIVMTRSFNHIGPGQKERFVISSFARQLVSFARKKQKVNELVTGNLNVIRDFVDVRDVVRAYHILLRNGKRGEVYNICSGKGIMLSDIVEKMAGLLDLKIQIRVNPDLIRPNENKTIIGSHLKIKKELGWQPEIPIEKSLTDIISYWEALIS